MLEVQLVGPNGHASHNAQLSGMATAAIDNADQVQERVRQHIHHDMTVIWPQRNNTGGSKVHRHY